MAQCICGVMPQTQQVQIGDIRLGGNMMRREEQPGSGIDSDLFTTEESVTGATPLGIDYTKIDLSVLADGLQKDLADVEKQVKKMEEAEIVRQEVLQLEFSI